MKTPRLSRMIPVIALSVLIAAAAAAGIARYSRGSASFLLCRTAFDYFLLRDSRELTEQARSGLSSTYYFTSYYLNGMLSAAEGTSSDRILRHTLRLIDTMLDSTRSFESSGKTYRAWPPFSIAHDTSIPRPNLHYTFQAAIPVIRAAAVIMNSPRWREKYGDTARRYIEYVDRNVVGYWYRDQLGESIPWINPDQFPLWNDNGSNLCLIFTYLYQATGDPAYRKPAERIGRNFRARLERAGDGWIWENQTIPIGSDTDNTPGSVGNQAGVPDTSHANREAFLMVSLFEAGIYFSRDDVERMAGTLTGALWNGSRADPSFANYIDGSNKPYRVYKQPGLNGSIYHGWALTGGYSEKAQEALVATLRAIIRGRNNPSLERNAKSYGGRLALCGHLLRNFRILEENRRAARQERYNDSHDRATVPTVL